MPTAITRSIRDMAGATDADLRILRDELTEAISKKFASTWSTQVLAWNEELQLLRDAARHLIETGYHDGLFALEYPIPRRGKRPDAVLVVPGALVVLEFKVGAERHDSTARWQAAEYALDFRDFHSASADFGTAALIIATKAPSSRPVLSEQGVPVFLSGARDIGPSLSAALARARSLSRCSRSIVDWAEGHYRPTPTIIEAAEALYVGNDIFEINHSYADNLTLTTNAIVGYIERARREQKRIICFVTGVPGAGKTLTGLDAVHDPRLVKGDSPPGVFLSGNGPLVRVLQTALSRRGRQESRKESRRTVKTFVQNVHVFVEEYAENSSRTPHENVVVFDEAQRAWSAEKMAKKRRGDFSEPEQMIEIMERCPETCVIVALVGGGQEIHEGEAGLSEWGRALTSAGRKRWIVAASPEVLQGGTSVSGHRLFSGETPGHVEVLPDSNLHLRTSVRTPRAQKVAEWVEAILSGRPADARRLAGTFQEFPLAITRDLRVAKAWLRARGAGGARVGLVASAGAKRLRAYGLQLSTRVGQNDDIDEWFLADPTDVRSSNFLEVAATEFECQGLELDFVGLCWGDDLTRSDSSEWDFKKFRGSDWSPVGDEQDRAYMLNKYRVLLTRSRRGMILWIPRGSLDDATRPPAPLERTWEYLLKCGVPQANATVVDHGERLTEEVQFSE